jgi:glycosyltransferase involved in cell wall biosynthesis
MPKVSIVIPVYNVEKYLRQCLDSVVNQTLKDIEIICVNDGSTDNSLQILEEYANKDDRIKIINKDNGGLSSARNAGLEIATGVYIGFVDSDDYIEIETYNEAYKLTSNNYYHSLRDKMVNRVKAYIRKNGAFPGGLTLSK